MFRPNTYPALGPLYSKSTSRRPKPCKQTHPQTHGHRSDQRAARSSTTLLTKFQISNHPHSQIPTSDPSNTLTTTSSKSSNSTTSPPPTVGRQDRNRRTRSAVAGAGIRSKSIRFSGAYSYEGPCGRTKIPLVVDAMAMPMRSPYHVGVIFHTECLSSFDPSGGWEVPQLRLHHTLRFEAQRGYLSISALSQSSIGIPNGLGGRGTARTIPTRFLQLGRSRNRSAEVAPYIG